METLKISTSVDMISTGTFQFSTYALANNHNGCNLCKQTMKFTFCLSAIELNGIFSTQENHAILQDQKCMTNTACAMIDVCPQTVKTFQAAFLSILMDSAGL